MPSDAASEGARYRAFISYSHADAAFGRRLHRWLEGYGVPGRLVGRPTARGPVPRRLSPIFRDREELPADGDLSAQVRAALAQSAALVVVCSPRAAASPWVGREVALFRELHPDRPVLAALIDGEPADAFPEILRAGGAEPLAADFRDGRDGARLGLLKLVAGIVGVGLDELVQRDTQRRLRGVMAVTAGSLAAMVAMGVLTLFALNARAEAERERAKAEGLVEFMITDLREKLKGVGRLDVMSTVNQRALGYYADQDLERLPAASLERRAEILHAIGEDLEAGGNLDRALAQFREARRTTAALLAADPDDPDRIYAHAQSEYWVAFIDWRKGRIAAARAGLERYAELAGRLLVIDPKNPDWLMEGGYAESNLGTLQLRDTGDAKGAEGAFTRSLAHFRAAERIKPGSAASDIADAYAWIADSRRAQGRFDEARAARVEEARILDQLQAADPRDVTHARDLLGNAVGQAQIDFDAGQPRAAWIRLEQTWGRARTLAASDPQNARLARQRIAVGVFMARAVVAAGGPSEKARAGLAECQSRLAQEDEEVRDLCAVAAARLARAEARPTDPAYDYLRRNRERMTKSRLSEQWGVDFSREINSLG